MNETELAQFWGDLLNYGVATEDELQLVTDVAGYNVETLSGVLYSRTGYREMENYLEEEQ